jgi:hypothetical protein
MDQALLGKLQSASDKLTSFLLENTPDNSGFEEIPEVDEARTLILEVIEGL